MKEKLFELLFPSKKKEIIELTHRVSYIELNLSALEQRPTDFGFQFEFNGVDDFGKPAHYLEGLSEEGRKYYVGSMESIYTDDKFQDVIKYCINLYGNKAIHVLPEEHMRDGRYAILGIKTILQEFENAHREFINNKKQNEEFDPLEILPEN